MTETPQAVTLYFKRSSAIWHLLSGAALVAAGIWMGMTEDWIGFPIAAFFGLYMLVIIVKLVPGSTYL